MNGQELTFHLAGINNQNFIMRDDETGTWWQQISGKAIQGPLTGAQLANVDMDEVSFAVWKKENPDGRVLRPDGVAGHAESADWEQQVGRMPVTTSATPDSRLEPRTLVVGAVVGQQAKAYPFDAVVKQSPILDILGDKHIVLFVAEDRESVRGFDREIDGRVLEFFVKPGSGEIVDAETGSTWDFSGRAVGGEMAGKQLAKIWTIKDYWFDWKTYHPGTQLYTLGER